MLTLEERTQIIKWYYAGNSYQDVINLFTVAFEGREIPGKSHIQSLVKQFEKTGCVAECSGCHPKSRTAADPDAELQEIMICATVDENPTLSCEAIADELGLSRTRVFNVLKKQGYKSFKVTTTREMFPDDAIRRMEFCETVMEKANEDPEFINNIVFTDESSFPLHRRHNPSIVRNWSRKNPHCTAVSRSQYRGKVNVWCGILGNNIIGPFWINGNLNAARYLELLQNQIIPAIQQIPGINFDRLWFQQDGCPAHNTAQIMNFLHTHFQDRIIGHGTINWPARSPDLTPLDFFLWGHLKQEIFGHAVNRPTDIDDLKRKIQQSVERVSPWTLDNVLRSFYDRLGHCLAVEGGLFEHLL